MKSTKNDGKFKKKTGILNKIKSKIRKEKIEFLIKQSGAHTYNTAYTPVLHRASAWSKYGKSTGAYA